MVDRSDSRSNSRWLADLRATGEVRDAALTDLRAQLMQGLTVALAARGMANPSFLEDVVQESLVKVLAHLDDFRGESRFMSWAVSIAVRTAITELRRQRWKDVSLEAAAERPGYAHEPPDDPLTRPQVLVERKAILQQLNTLIETVLTDKQRVALRAELGGMPLEEIARKTGSNRNAIYKLTHDARKRLKQGLEAAGYSAADVCAVFSC